MVRLLILLLPSLAFSATHYVKNGGSDGADGRSDATAWATVSKVNSTAFAPGDSVLFKRGSLWRETLQPTASGSSVAPIVFGAYGSGESPIFDGSDVLTGWTSSGANVYYTQADWGGRPPTVSFRDGVLGRYTSVASLSANGDWAYSYPNLYVYSTDSPSGHLMEAGRRFSCIAVMSVGYVTFSNLKTQKGNGFNVLTEYSHHVLLENLDVLYSSSSGICIQQASHYVTVKGGRVYWNGYSSYTPSSEDCNGIGLGGVGASSTYMVIDGVEVFENLNDGISAYIPDRVDTPTPNLIVQNCVVRNTVRGGGIRMDGKGQWARFDHNVVHDNAYAGIQHGDGWTGSGTTRLDVYHNTVVRNGHEGIVMDGVTTDLRFKNNIVLMNGDANYSDFCIYSSVTNLESDYNVWSPPSMQRNAVLFQRSGYPGMNLPAWQATGQDLRSRAVDPMLNLDFTLQSGSPAIGSGINLGWGTDIGARTTGITPPPPPQNTIRSLWLSR